MSKEDNKKEDINEEAEAEQPVAAEIAGLPEEKVPVEEEVGHVVIFEDEPLPAKKSGQEIGGIELPDSVKAKLEKRKEAKAKAIKKKKGKKKKDKRVAIGKAFIKSTYNNTIVSLTDLNGNLLSWASAGVAGFKGPKKATPYAAQIITKIASMRAKEDYGLKEVSVFVKGVGTGREAAIRALNANGLIITSIKDMTPIPHNGCRAKKPRRV